MRVEFEGLDEFTQGLRRVDTKKTLQASYRKTIRQIVADTRSNIMGAQMPQRSVAASGVNEVVTAEAAGIELDPRNPVVKAAIFGTRIHHLWGIPVEASQLSRRVFPEWVGANFEPDKDLHALSPAIDLDDIADEWLDDMHRAIGKGIDAKL